LLLLTIATVAAGIVVGKRVSHHDQARTSPDQGMSLLQVGAKAAKRDTMAPKRAAQILVDTVDTVLPASPPSGLGPVVLLHIPYNHIAVNATYRNFAEQLATFPQRRPREFNVMLATFKTWAADMVVQLLEKKRGGPWKFDWRRSFAFALFGFVYVGLTQWVLYVTLLTWMFPDAMVFANSPISMKLTDTTGQLDMVGQVIVDNFVFNVLIYFPAFYIIKTMCQGSPTTSFLSRAQAGLNKYWTNIISDNMAAMALWIPADVFIFTAPMYLRMPLDHGVSLAWTMFISFTRGAATEKSKLESKLEA
jgi:hypothetical protein